MFSPTGYIHPLPHSIREASLVISSNPGLVHILCHFSSAKNHSWIGNLGSLNCPSCLVTSFCFFGYSCLFWRLLLISGLPVKVLFYLLTCMPGSHAVSERICGRKAPPWLLFWASDAEWTQALKPSAAVTESQNHSCWKGAWVVSTHMSCAGLWRWVLETSKGRRFHHLSGQPVPVLHCSHGDIFFLIGSQNLPSVVRDRCIPSSHPALQDRAWLYFLSSLVSIEGFCQFFLKLSLIQAEQAHLPQLLLTGQELQPPECPGGLHWSHLSVSASFLHWEVQNQMQYSSCCLMIAE